MIQQKDSYSLSFAYIIHQIIYSVLVNHNWLYIAEEVGTVVKAKVYA